MAYIGRGLDKISNIEKLDVITFDGSQSYTLQKNSTNFVPVSANNLIVSIDGVVQAGNFTVSGSTIDFGVAVASTSTCDFIMHFGTGVTTQPSDGSVTDAKLAASAINSQTAETSVADGDEVLIYDTSASALRKMTRSNFVSGLGGLVKLATTDVTTATSAIVFDSSVVTAYDNYYITINGLKTSSNSASGAIMFSTDNGSTFIGRNKFTASYKNLDTGTVGNVHTGTFSLNSVTNPAMWDNNATEPLNGYFYFFNANPAETTNSVHCAYNALYISNGGSRLQQDGSVMYSVTSGQQINYFKIVNSSVNISAGKVTLYGFNQ